jgi:hypothetical protein
VNPLSNIQLVTKEKVAEQLSLELTDIQKLVDTGQLPTIRIHGKERFDVRDIAKLVNTYKRVQRGSNEYEDS